MTTQGVSSVGQVEGEAHLDAGDRPGVEFDGLQIIADGTAEESTSIPFAEEGVTNDFHRDGEAVDQDDAIVDEGLEPEGGSVTIIVDAIRGECPLVVRPGDFDCFPIDDLRDEDVGRAVDLDFHRRGGVVRQIACVDTEAFAKDGAVDDEVHHRALGGGHGNCEHLLGAVGVVQLVDLGGAGGPVVRAAHGEGGEEQARESQKQLLLHSVLHGANPQDVCPQAAGWKGTWQTPIGPTCLPTFKHILRVSSTLKGPICGQFPPPVYWFLRGF